VTTGKKAEGKQHSHASNSYTTNNNFYLSNGGKNRYVLSKKEKSTVLWQHGYLFACGYQL